MPSAAGARYHGLTPPLPGGWDASFRAGFGPGSHGRREPGEKKGPDQARHPQKLEPASPALPNYGIPRLDPFEENMAPHLLERNTSLRPHGATNNPGRSLTC